MIRNRVRFSTVRIVTAVAVFATQTGLANAAGSSVWSERRAKSSSIADTTQLAALPSLFSPEPVSALASHAETTRSPLSKDLQDQLTRHGVTIPLATLRPLSGMNGSIRGVVPAAPHAGPARTLIYLQDVHLNREAQDNIRATVEALFKNGGVDLLALEGAFAAVDTSVYRHFSRPQWVTAVADYLYRENKISGAVRAAMTAPGTIPPVQGVDDPSLYDANVAAFRAAYPQIPQLKEEARQRELAIGARKAFVFSPALREFDAVAVAYRKDELSLGTYARRLTVNAAVSDNMTTFLAALTLEEKINTERVASERTAALTRLGEGMKPAEIKSLTDHATAYGLGALSHAEFYGYIRALCTARNFSLGAYPAFDHYIRYVLLSDKIRVEPLMEELDRLESARYAALARTPEEKNLLAQARHSLLVGKLLNFALTAKEWEEYKVPPHASQWGGKEGNRFSSFEAFYLAAEARDRAMTEKLLKEMDQTHARVAVLVTGGFHTSGVTRALAERGVTSVVFVPKVTKVEKEDGVGYLSVFAQEKTPLDRLFDGEKLFVPPHVSVPPAMGDVLVGLEGAATEGAAAANKRKVELPDLPANTQFSGGNGSATAQAEENTIEGRVDDSGNFSASAISGPTRRFVIQSGIIAAIMRALDKMAWGQQTKKTQRPASKARATAKTKSAGPAAMVDQETLDGLAASIEKMKVRGLYESNRGDPEIRHWSFLYDESILTRDLSVAQAVALLTQIYAGWSKHPDTFWDENRTSPAGPLPISAANPFDAQKQEFKVDTGPILHLGLAALATLARARELDPAGVRANKYKVLVDIATAVANYALKMQVDEKGPPELLGLVRHGPMGKADNDADQHFGFDLNADRLFDTATFEHQHEFRLFLRTFSGLYTDAAVKRRFQDAIEKNRIAALKFWDPAAKRFRGARHATKGLLKTFPTDQVWLISMEGVENLLTSKSMTLQDLRDFFAAIDENHSVKTAGEIIGYDYVPDRGALISVEWSAEVVAAKLQFATYLKKKSDPSWQAYAASAIKTARSLAKLKRGDNGGLAYAYDTDGNPAEGVDTGFGWKTQRGESLISSAYLLAVLRGIDPAAQPDAQFDLAGILRDLPPEMLNANQPAAAENVPEAVAADGDILDGAQSGIYDGRRESGAYAMYWNLENPRAFPAQQKLSVRFTAEQAGKVVLELIRPTDNEGNPQIWQVFDAKRGANQKIVTLPSGMRVRRVTFQIGTTFAHVNEIGGALNARPLSQLTDVSITPVSAATKKAAPKSKATKSKTSNARRLMIGFLAFTGSSLVAALSASAKEGVRDGTIPYNPASIPPEIFPVPDYTWLVLIVSGMIAMGILNLFADRENAGRIGMQSRFSGRPMLERLDIRSFSLFITTLFLFGPSIGHAAEVGAERALPHALSPVVVAGLTRWTHINPYLVAIFTVGSVVFVVMLNIAVDRERARSPKANGGEIVRSIIRNSGATLRSPLTWLRSRARQLRGWWWGGAVLFVVFIAGGADPISKTTPLSVVLGFVVLIVAAVVALRPLNAIDSESERPVPIFKPNPSFEVELVKRDVIIAAPQEPAERVVSPRQASAQGDLLATYLLSSARDASQEALRKNLEALEQGLSQLPKPTPLGVGENHWGVLPRATVAATEMEITSQLQGQSHSTEWSHWSRPFYAAQQTLARRSIATAPEMGDGNAYYVIDPLKTLEQTATEMEKIAAKLAGKGLTLYVGGEAESLAKHDTLLQKIRMSDSRSVKPLQIETFEIARVRAVDESGQDDGLDVVQALDALRQHLTNTKNQKLIDAKVTLLMDLHARYKTVEASDPTGYKSWMTLYGSVRTMDIKDFIDGLPAVTTVGVVTQLEGFIRAALAA